MNMERIVIPVRPVSEPVAAAASSCATSCPSAASCSSGASSCSGGPESELERLGYVPRTTIGEPRLSEIVENYRAMGYDVHVERWSTGSADCTTCYDEADKSGAGEIWGTVYVRQGSPAARTDDMLF